MSEARPPDPRGRFGHAARIDVDGLSIAYHRSGAGPPVVLVHGYVGDAWSTWRHQLAALSDEFTVVACDLPGAGASADPPEDFGLTGYADCLARFVEALELGPVHLVGLSLGGILAIEATRRRFRPIVMTSFAFILGVVPLVVAFGAGSASQRAIGTVVFGGMLSSTLLAIPFVPVFYVLMERLSERLGKGKGSPAKATGGYPVEPASLEKPNDHDVGG